MKLTALLILCVCVQSPFTWADSVADWSADTEANHSVQSATSDSDPDAPPANLAADEKFKWLNEHLCADKPAVAASDDESARLQREAAMYRLIGDQDVYKICSSVDDCTLKKQDYQKEKDALQAKLDALPQESPFQKANNEVTKAVNGQNVVFSPSTITLLKSYLSSSNDFTHQIQNYEKYLTDLKKAAAQYSEQNSGQTNFGLQNDIEFYGSQLDHIKQQQKQTEDYRNWLDQGAPAPNDHQSLIAKANQDLAWHNEGNPQVYMKEQIQEYDQTMNALDKVLKEFQAEPPSNTDAAEVAKGEIYWKTQLSVNTDQDCGLSVGEKAAISYYTGNGYGMINRDLRQGGAAAAKWAPFVDVVNHAFVKLRPYHGQVVRGSTLPADVLSQYQVGAVVTSPGYSSTAVVGGFGGNQTFIIQSKTGRWVAPLSQVEHEHEVLIPAGAQFKVLNIEGNTYTLEEVTP